MSKKKCPQCDEGQQVVELSNGTIACRRCDPVGYEGAVRARINVWLDGGKFQR